MTATLACDVDLDDYATLLDLSVRIASELTAEDWRVIVEGTRRAASVDQRVAALLLVAGPLTDVVEPADEQLLLRIALPRLSVTDRARYIGDVREALEQADRFAGMSDAGELADALDLKPGIFTDWVRVAEHETEKWRADARYIATQAATR